MGSRPFINVSTYTNTSILSYASASNPWAVEVLSHSQILVVSNKTQTIEIEVFIFDELRRCNGTVYVPHTGQYTFSLPSKRVSSCLLVFPELDHQKLDVKLESNYTWISEIRYEHFRPGLDLPIIDTYPLDSFFPDQPTVLHFSYPLVSPTLFHFMVNNRNLTQIGDLRASLNGIPTKATDNYTWISEKGYPAVPIGGQKIASIVFPRYPNIYPPTEIPTERPTERPTATAIPTNSPKHSNFISELLDWIESWYGSVMMLFLCGFLIGMAIGCCSCCCQHCCSVKVDENGQRVQRNQQNEIEECIPPVIVIQQTVSNPYGEPLFSEKTEAL